MDCLKVPFSFSCLRIERDDAITEKVDAFSIGAVKIISRRAGGKKHNTSFFIDAHASPAVSAACIFPRIPRPCIVTKFAGQWYGMKSPFEFSGYNVVCAYVSGLRAVQFRYFVAY